MNCKKLIELACGRSGDLKAFAADAGINYNTFYRYTRSDDRLDNMPISNFIKCAHALGVSADELFDILDC